MSEIKTKDPRFRVRRAEVRDAGEVLGYMHKLGAYQKMADQITASEASIEKLLATGQGEAVFGICDGVTAGFVFFNQTSSAFTGRTGLFIDALYVDQTMRGRGLGKVLMEFMAHEALARGCQMLEWGCLDWNAPAIAFYQGLGAYCLDIMRIYRLSPEDLKINAARL